MLDSAPEVAAFSIGMGYPRDDVLQTIRDLFPDADAVAVVDAAIAKVGERSATDDAAVERDERRAVEAEHNLDRSMHDTT